MATVYTPIKTAPSEYDLDPLRARMYADGVDIHTGRLSNGVFTPPHELRGCTTFQWQQDLLRNGSWVDLTDDQATTDTYIVDERDVANSGDYRCCIRTGEDDDCLRYTNIITIAIIDCMDVTTLVSFVGEGVPGSENTIPGSRTLSFTYPAFLGLILTRPPWIVQAGNVNLSTNPGVIIRQIGFTAVSTLREGIGSQSDDRDNIARNAYLDFMLGDFLCSYRAQQDYIRIAPPAPVDPVVDETPPPGPTLTITNVNETVRVGSLAFVSATASVLLPTGIDTTTVESDFTWSVTGPGISSSAPTFSFAGGMSFAFASFDTSTVGDKRIIFSVEANGITVTETAVLTVTADTTSTEAGAVSGELTGQITSRTVALGARDAPLLDPNTSVLGERFSVDSGLGSIFIRVVDRGISFIGGTDPYNGRAEIRYTITGPGIIGGAFTNTISLAPGTQAQGSFLDQDNFVAPIINSFSDGGTGGIANEARPGDVTATSTDAWLVNPAGLTPGNYTISMRVVSPGTAPPRTFNNRLYSPGGSYSVSPIFNFGFDLSNLNIPTP